MKHWLWGLFLLLSGAAQAQYFGRNQPHYRDFDFKVYQSPHFDVYHYLKDLEKVNGVAQTCEYWYQLHKAVFLDTFQRRNPFILYNNHADFQQTNAISGGVGVGTGGVTEAFKNRVVLPFTFTNQQTHHVIGHELVHAFQYNAIINGDSTSLQNVMNIPLWMVEGLAEYLSIGKVDANTALWMRDAVLNDDVPSFKDLSTNPKYFPYRYGQAFWAFITGYYGDDKIAPFFMNTAKYGLEMAIDSTFNTNLKTLSSMWQEALKTYYTPLVGNDKKENFIGKKLIHKGNAGEMNVSPSISPNGRYVVFLSEKDLFSTDLFLADALTGKILNKVTSSLRETHIDALNYLESSGTWSPNSEEFAFVGFAKGRNVLIVKEAKSGRTLREIAVPGVEALSNPAWSPDGKRMFFSGSVEGQTDLYAYDLKTGQTDRLTNDPYSEIQPSFSPDGKWLTFATDQLSNERGKTFGKWTFNIALRNIETGETLIKDFFFGANNLNPVFDNEGNILFLSDRDGFRNVYLYNIIEDKISQLTQFKVGVTGITEYSPALTVARKRDRILYSQYYQGKYDIYQSDKEDFVDVKTISPDSLNFWAATLPPLGLGRRDIVNARLDSMQVADLPPGSFKEVGYKPKFKLDYLGGGGGVAVGNSNAFGTATGMAGGVDMLFSDILGNNQLYSGISLNGEIFDIAGQFAYINRKNKIGWGASYSHFPYQALGNYAYLGVDTLYDQFGNGILAHHEQLDRIRQFEDRVGGFGFIPLSSTRRVEAGASYARYYYRIDREDLYYDAYGQLVYRQRNRQDAPKGFNLINLNAAFVGDNSYFGMTAPLRGYRYRIGAEQYLGDYHFTAATLDYRHYFYLKPISLAVRGLHYGRYYGKNSERFPDIYLGNPILVRGYSSNRSDEILSNNGHSIYDLVGSKIFIGNFEVRLPFTGPERLALIKSRFLFTDLAAFVDGGVAWEDFSDFEKPDGELGKPLPVFSAGLSLRFNLLGALILEPFYAWPIMKGTKGSFGINIVPGW